MESTKKFLKNNLIKVLIAIIIFQFTFPSTSKAVSVGGVLFSPIQDFVLALGDAGEGVLSLAAFGSYSQSVITLKKDNAKWYEEVWGKMKSGSPIFFISPQLTTEVTLIKRAARKVIGIFTDDDFKNEIQLPVMQVTPDKIFSNQIPLLDINVINPKSKNEKIDPNDENSKKVGDTPANVLQSTISQWYIILRNIVAVIFLSMLVYIGIKIVIASAAEDKAEYKEMLLDWFIGLCLLFFMHYGMSFLLEVNDRVISFLAGSNNDIVLTIDSKETKFNFSEFTDDLDTVESGDKLKDVINVYNVDDNGNPVMDQLTWHTDMAGMLRFEAQSNIKSNTTLARFGYTVLYIILVIYSWIFFIKYLMRFLHMVFLTLAAPFVAMSYPIDKMNDGSAQIFNSWVKEYIFTLLLQPMHMILYTILISSAIDLAKEYPIYAMVVYGCMLQAEKLVKKMFGFDRASLGRGETSGFLGGFTGSAVWHGMDRVFNNMRHRNVPPPGGKGAGKIGSGDDGKVVYANNRTEDSGSDDIVDTVLGSSNPAELGSGNESEDFGTSGGDSGNYSYGQDDGNSGSAGQFNDNNNEELNSGDADSGNNIITGFNNSENAELDGNNGTVISGGIIPSAELSGDNGNIDDNSIRLADNKTSDESIPVLGTGDNSEPSNNGEGEENNIGENNNSSEPNVGTTNVMNIDYKTPQKKKLKHPVRSKAGAWMHAYGKPILKTVGKAGIRMAAAGFAGGVGATMGVASGLASDDMSNVLKYGAAGLGGGMLAGDSAAKNAMNGIPRAGKAVYDKVNNAHDEYIKEQARIEGDKSINKDYINQKSDEKFLKDKKEIREKYELEFGKANAKEKMRDALQYRKYGITDDDIIIKAMKSDSGEIGKTASTDPRRIAAAKLATGVDSSKDVDHMVDRLTKKGYNKKTISETEDFVRTIKDLKYK